MSDLVDKEREFRKLNHELEMKTRDVMKEIDSIIHARASESLLGDANQLHSNFVQKDIKTARPEDVSKMCKQRASLTKVSEISSIESIGDMEISPKRNDNVGNNVITLLRTKINTLYKQLRTMQLEYDKQCNYLKELEAENKKLYDNQVKLHNQIGILNDTIAKVESINSDATSNYQVVSNENLILKKDIDSLRKELKMLNQQSANYDVRLNRSLESSEKLRNTLKHHQVEEKELRNQIRKLQEDKRSVTKHFEHQQSELIQAFKKQVLIIENLKKQITHLIANERTHLLEEDFAKLLEWKPEQL